MDKYFAASYDPRFDVSLSDLTHSNGLIAPGAFEGWDGMLEVLKDRKEEKRRDKERRHEERERIRKRRRGELVEEEDGEEGGLGQGGKAAQAAKRGDQGLMGVQYASKGTTREWDLGKVDST